MIRMFKWVAGVCGAGLVLLCATAFVLFMTAYGRDEVRRFIEWQAGKKINGRLSVGKVAGSPWEYVYLQDVSITLPGYLGGAEVVGADEISIGVSGWDYLRYGRPVSVVRIDGLRIAYLQDVDGKGMDAITALTAGRTETPDTSVTSGFKPPFSIPEIHIARGRFLYFDPRDSTALDAKNFFLRGSMWKSGRIKAIIGTHSSTFTLDGYTDNLSTIFANVELHGDTLKVNDLTLEATAAPPLAFHVEGVVSSIRSRTADLTVKATGSVGSITRILGMGTPIEGRFSFSAFLRHTLTDPDIEAHLESPIFDTDIGSFKLVSLDLRYARNVLAIDRFRGRHETGTLSGRALLDMSAPEYRYELVVAPAELALEALPFSLIGETFPVVGKATVGAELHGIGFDALPTLARLDIQAPTLWIGGKRVDRIQGEARYRNGDLRLSVRNPAAQVAVSGTIQTGGVVHLDVEAKAPDIKAVTDLLGMTPVQGAADLSATLDGSIDRPDIRFSGQAQKLRVAEVPLGHLEVAGFYGADRMVRFDARLDTTRAVLSGEVEWTGDYPLTGMLRTQNLRLKDYIVSDPGIGLDALLKIEGELEGTLANPLFRGNGLVQDLTLRGADLGNASVAIKLRNPDLTFTIVKPDLSVIADGLVSLTDGYPYDLRVNIKRANLSPALGVIARRPIERRTGWVTGRIEAKGLASYPDQSTVVIGLDSLAMIMDDRNLHFSAPSTIKLDKQLLTIDHFELVGDIGHILVNGIASLTPGGIVNLEAFLEGVHLDFVSPFMVSQGALDGTLDGLFSLNGSPDAPTLNGTLYSADVFYSVDRRVNQIGSISASVLYEDRMLRMPALNIRTPMGSSMASVEYPIDLRWAGGDTLPLDTRYTASAVMENLSIAPLRELVSGFMQGLDGLIHGRIELVGSTINPEELTGTVAIDALRLTGLQNELVNTDSILIAFSRGYADVKTFDVVIRPLHDAAVLLGRISAKGRLAYGTGLKQPVESDFQASFDHVAIDAALSLTDIDVPLSGLVDGRITVSGPPSETSIDTRFSAGQIRYNDALMDSITGRIVYGHDQLVLHDLSFLIKGNLLAAYGNIPLSPDTGGMAITIEGTAIDLSFLNGGLYELERVGGTADIRLAVGGTPTAPRSQGEIYIRNADIQIRDVNPPLRAPEMRFRVEENRIVLRPVEFKTGKGKISLSGRATFDRSGIDDFETQLALSRSEIEMVGTARVVVNGTLSVTGNRKRSQAISVNAPISLAGSIIYPLDLSDLVLGTGAVIRPPKAPDPFLENMQLDVELDVPSLRVKNDLADMELEGGLAFSGTAQNPIVTGYATAKEGGNIVYIDTRFAVETGRIEFILRNPLESFVALIDDPIQQLDPQITLIARAPRVRDIYGAEYEVVLGLNGRTLQLSPQLTAAPIDNVGSNAPQSNLVDQEVVSLLTFGLPGITTEGATDAVAGLGQRALLMATGSSAQRVLKLDEFRIEGDVFNNRETRTPAQITISKRINQRAQVTFTRLFDSSDYKLRVGYQLTNYLFIETFTDQLSEHPQNGLDLKVKFRFR
ncbi:MAG: translocation/assembly module TamB domain-containing protein [candidate division Zixibacteria bacterium]|nr:translocation/assembly module TamB domain-containing protein [candidate division Zixibacteria bacterium]